MKPFSKTLVGGFYVLFLSLLSSNISADASKIAYPEGYASWHHVKSMVLFEGHPLANPFAGIHHVYANPAALKGLQGGRYADGAVLAFDLFEVKEGAEALQEGLRKLLGVMMKDAKRYATTGGWGFEGFAGNSKDQRLVSDGGQGCFACHTQVTERDYVFSTLRQ